MEFPRVDPQVGIIPATKGSPYYLPDYNIVKGGQYIIKPENERFSSVISVPWKRPEKFAVEKLVFQFRRNGVLYRRGFGRYSSPLGSGIEVSLRYTHCYKTPLGYICVNYNIPLNYWISEIPNKIRRHADFEVLSDEKYPSNYYFRDLLVYTWDFTKIFGFPIVIGKYKIENEEKVKIELMVILYDKDITSRLDYFFVQALGRRL